MYSSSWRLSVVICLFSVQVVIPELFVAGKFLLSTLNVTFCIGAPDTTFFKYRLYFPVTTGLSASIVIFCVVLSNVTFTLVFTSEFTVDKSVNSIEFVESVLLIVLVFPSHSTVTLFTTYLPESAVFCTFTVIGEANSSKLFSLSSTSVIAYTSVFPTLSLVIEYESTNVILPLLFVFSPFGLFVCLNSIPSPNFLKLSAVFINSILYVPAILLFGIVMINMLFSVSYFTLIFTVPLEISGTSNSVSSFIDTNPDSLYVSLFFLAVIQ